MPRLVMLFLFIIMISGFPLEIASASEGGNWHNGAYPTPYVGPVFETGTNVAHWLIVGAFVIVLIVFLGVAFRRPKS
jgi:hypothetical protein